MNQTLANIYGNGIEKTATSEEITLDNISAADFLAAVESGDIDLDSLTAPEEAEKTAGEYDLSDFSEDDLIEAYNALEQEEADTTLEKMASDGSFEYWDNAGRIMAHAMVDEQEKTASAEFDLNDLTEDEIIDLASELYMEKEAASAAALAKLKNLGAWARGSGSTLKRSYKSGLGQRRSRSTGQSEIEMKLRALAKTISKHPGKAALVTGVPTAATAATAGGAYALSRKKS